VLIYYVVQDLTLQEAETIALSILKQVMEEKVKLKLNACTSGSFPLTEMEYRIKYNVFPLYFSH
jgi:hypothetical protein